MMDPDYPIGIADGILAQLDYLMRLSEKAPDMRPDLLQKLHDGVNEYKAALAVDCYESLRRRALRHPVLRIGRGRLHVSRVRALLPVHRPGGLLRPVFVPVRGGRGLAPGLPPGALSLRISSSNPSRKTPSFARSRLTVMSSISALDSGQSMSSMLIHTHPPLFSNVRGISKYGTILRRPSLYSAMTG